MNFQERISLYWWEGELNVGDQLNPYLIKKLVGQNVQIDKVEKGSNKPHYFCIGSVIRYANENTTIWGSGIIGTKMEHLPAGVPDKILAVRGPLTREILKKNDIDAPECYGDPGILLSDLYQNISIEKKYEIGIIPHFVDLDKNTVRILKTLKGVKLINVKTDNIENFVDQILSCKTILSSSLHGLIIADAYQIPNVWVNFKDHFFDSDKVVGKGFKFHDYFESVDRFQSKPLRLSREKDLARIINHLQVGNTETIKRQLLHSNPFKR